ncbi:hypothetical protein VNO77_44245 [Canavalia gladiata]|uniref:Uncharacterized protein n=1 Tax=Canavalia gladiata TaxID=3824 RepID=A0AAN9JY67_CANGL
MPSNHTSRWAMLRSHSLVHIPNDLILFRSSMAITFPRRLMVALFNFEAPLNLLYHDALDLELLLRTLRQTLLTFFWQTWVATANGIRLPWYKALGRSWLHDRMQSLEAWWPSQHELCEPLRLEPCNVHFSTVTLGDPLSRRGTNLNSELEAWEAPIYFKTAPTTSLGESTIEILSARSGRHRFAQSSMGANLCFCNLFILYAITMQLHRQEAAPISPLGSISPSWFLRRYTSPFRSKLLNHS